MKAFLRIAPEQSSGISPSQVQISVPSSEWIHRKVSRRVPELTQGSLPLHHNYTVDLDDQVKQWDLYARKTLDLEPADTLVAFWIGSV